MGIIIHSLESVSFKDLYAAFSSAFKDYDFSLNADELRRMLDRRGYNPQLSFGAFFEGRLISFVFNGTGMYNNILTAYDTGTGTVPSFRGLHLTQKIFTFSLELIYQQGVRQYVLEVLQHNHKAIKIYRKLGFETQRNFNYYRITETTSVTGFSLRNDEEDKERILRALKQADGNRKVAAELLGIGRTTLYNKLEEYGLKYKFEQP